MERRESLNRRDVLAGTGAAALATLGITAAAPAQEGVLSATPADSEPRVGELGAGLPTLNDVTQGRESAGTTVRPSGVRVEFPGGTAEVYVPGFRDGKDLIIRGVDQHAASALAIRLALGDNNWNMDYNLIADTDHIEATFVRLRCFGQLDNAGPAKRA